MRASDESTKLLPNKNKKKQKKIQAFDSITSQSWITIYRTYFFYMCDIQWRQRPLRTAAVEIRVISGDLFISTCVYQQSPGGDTRQYIFLYRETFVYIIVSPFGMWISTVRPVIIWILILFSLQFLYFLAPPPSHHSIRFSLHVLRPSVFVRHLMGRAKKAWDDRRESREW